MMRLWETECLCCGGTGAVSFRLARPATGDPQVAEPVIRVAICARCDGKGSFLTGRGMDVLSFLRRHLRELKEPPPPTA